MIIAIPFRGPRPNKIRCRIASQILEHAAELFFLLLLRKNWKTRVDGRNKILSRNRHRGSGRPLYPASRRRPCASL